MKIVAAVDGSPSSIRALDRAVELAEALSANLSVITVVHLSGFYYSALAQSVTPATESDIEDSITSAVWDTIDEHLAELTQTVEIERVSARGHAGQEIVDLATKIDAELIVVGSRGFGPIKSSVLGSTGRYVTQHARCDVMVVRAEP